jgi:hypothetical protein
MLPLTAALSGCFRLMSLDPSGPRKQGTVADPPRREPNRFQLLNNLGVLRH